MDLMDRKHQPRVTTDHRHSPNQPPMEKFKGLTFNTVAIGHLQAMKSDEFYYHFIQDVLMRGPCLLVAHCIVVLDYTDENTSFLQLNLRPNRPHGFASDWTVRPPAVLSIQVTRLLLADRRHPQSRSSRVVDSYVVG